MNTISKSRTNLTILLSVCLTLLTAAIWFVLVGREVSASSDSVDTVSLTVPIACTMTGEGTSHTATLDPGTYSGASGSEYENGIGKTTLTAICNDDNGFSIYAIGYTGNSYDSENHTKLVGFTTGGTIATKAYTSGDTTSNWSMKLTKITDSTESYNPQNLTISTGYDTWHAVPDTYTKVAQYHANTGSSTTDTTLGVKLETTYAAYISSSQPADTYVGQVKYTLVHPYDELPPVRCRPDGTTISTITCMQDVQMTNRDSVLASMNEGQQYTLYDKRDKKPYTVARLADGNIWMTQNLDLDIDSNTTYTNEDTDIGYIPEEGGSYSSASWMPVFSTIKGDASSWWSSATVPISYDPGELYFDPTYRDLQLFSSYVMFSNMEEYQSFLPEFIAALPVDMQEFIASCDAEFLGCDEDLLLEEHRTIRETYKVTAYVYSCVNGTCNENIYNALSDDWKVYMESCGAEMDGCDSSLAPESASVFGLTEDGASLTTGIPQYHVGNYYNWTAALSINSSENMFGTGKVIEQSICPSGWTLPRGDEEEDSFHTLLNQYGYVVNPSDFSSNSWWNSPLYLIPAGAISSLTHDNNNAKSMFGYYWSATSYSPSESYGLKFMNMGQTNLTEKLARERGYSVRCVARPVRYTPDSGGVTN